MGLACAQWPPFSLDEMETLALQEEIWQAGAGRISSQLLHLKESTGETRAAAENSHRLISLIRKDAHQELLAYEQQHARVQDLVEASAEHKRASGDMIELAYCNAPGGNHFLNAEINPRNLTIVKPRKKRRVYFV